MAVFLLQFLPLHFSREREKERGEVEDRREGELCGMHQYDAVTSHTSVQCVCRKSVDYCFQLGNE